MSTVRSTLDELKSAVTLIEGLSARLDAIIAQAGDPAAVIADLETLKSELDTSGAAIMLIGVVLLWLDK